MEDVGLECCSFHEHPLSYNDDQQEDWCCSACGLPLLLSPSYRCNNDCSFFLHKSCKQLPPQLNYVATNGKKYSLVLVPKPPNEAWTCDACSESCKNLIAYHFSEGSDNINVDALCSPVPLEIKSGHDSHEHELVAVRRRVQTVCDVCRRQDKGFFFTCGEYCDFWIHKDCDVLPRVIEISHHRYPLAFSYSAITTESFFSNSNCLICKDKFFGPAAYYCMLFRILVHSSCALLGNIIRSGYEPVQLPVEEANKSLFIHKILNERRVEKNQIDDEKLGIEKYHKHPLILFHDTDSSSSPKQCNACIKLITSPPFYICEEPGCDFILHKHCSNLPSEIFYPLTFGVYDDHNRRAEIVKADHDYNFSLFYCELCNQRCNGFGYKAEDYGWKLDIECCSMPKRIKHQLHHRQHILCLLPENSAASDTTDSGIVYKCTYCDFIIHTKCALLPTKVSHKFDKHPLHLSSKDGRGTNHIISDSEHCFCEICEGNIDTKFWFYQCTECDQFFHINCIPSVGIFSKIKFGCTLVIPSCHPEDHPVILTRMLDIGNQRCEECDEIIQGFTDEMAFQCSKCWYWIHFHCAPRAVRDLKNSRWGWNLEFKF